jgi:hypothetical protein
VAQLITGLFPDRETAEHAMSRFEALGLRATRTNAEAFDRPEYYKNQMPQGATLVSVEAVERAEDVLRIIVECGGRSVEGVAQGESGMPTAMTGNPAGSVPVVEVERRAFAEKGQQSRAEWREDAGR